MSELEPLDELRALFDAERAAPTLDAGIRRAIRARLAATTGSAALGHAAVAFGGAGRILSIVALTLAAGAGTAVLVKHDPARPRGTAHRRGRARRAGTADCVDDTAVDPSANRRAADDDHHAARRRGDRTDAVAAGRALARRMDRAVAEPRRACARARATTSTRIQQGPLAEERETCGSSRSRGSVDSTTRAPPRRGSRPAIRAASTTISSNTPYAAKESQR